MGNDVDRTASSEDGAALPVLRGGAIAELREEGDEFLLDLIDLFLNETPTRLAALATALDEGDRTSAQRGAHTLKSTAAIFGADTMVALATSAELAAVADDLPAVARLLAPLRTAAQHVQVVLLAERKALLP